MYVLHYAPEITSTSLRRALEDLHAPCRALLGYRIPKTLHTNFRCLFHAMQRPGSETARRATEQVQRAPRPARPDALVGDLRATGS